MKGDTNCQASSHILDLQNEISTFPKRLMQTSRIAEKMEDPAISCQRRHLGVQQSATSLSMAATEPRSWQGDAMIHHTRTVQKLCFAKILDITQMLDTVYIYICIYICK